MNIVLLIVIELIIVMSLVVSAFYLLFLLISLIYRKIHNIKSSSNGFCILLYDDCPCNCSCDQCEIAKNYQEDNCHDKNK